MASNENEDGGDKSPGQVATVARPSVPAQAETSSSAIAAREKAAIEARFLYAAKFPRDFDLAFARLKQSCRRPGFARLARYAKPVGGSKVTGLSVRFAEEAMVLWGNMDVTSAVVLDDDLRRTYRVQGVDLETNATKSADILIEKFVERRQVRSGMEVIGERQNTQGQIVYKIRATEDDLLVKVNNQIAKAARNIILALLPADVKEECEALIVQTTSNEDAKDPDAARKRVVDAFFAIGIMPDQLVELLGHPLEQLNKAETALLHGYYTSLKEGDAQWADILEAHGKKAPESAQTEAPAADGEKSGTAGLKASVKAKAAKTEPPVTSGQAADGEAMGKGDEPPAAEPATVKKQICAECKVPKGQPHKQSCWFHLHPNEKPKYVDA